MSNTIHQARTNYSHDDRTDLLHIEDEGNGTMHLSIMEFGGRQDTRAGIFLNKAQWRELAVAATRIAADMDDKPKGSPTAEHLTTFEVQHLQNEKRLAAAKEA